jgi:hypothetical protein
MSPKRRNKIQNSTTPSQEMLSVSLGSHSPCVVAQLSNSSLKQHSVLPNPEA